LYNLTSDDFSVTVNPSIFLAEDNPGDVYLVREALALAGVHPTLHVAQDGEQAFNYIDKLDGDNSLTCPNVVLLDINLPKRSGHEIMQRLLRSARCCGAPVIVFTSSDAPGDRRTFEAMGVSHYFRKPSSFDDFMKIGEIVRKVLQDPPQRNQSMVIS